MNVFELMAKIGLDTTEYNFGLDAIKNGAATIGSLSAKALGAATAAVTAFGISSIKTGMGFDTAMSQVAATMGKTVDQMMGGQNPFEGKETQEIEVDGDKYIACTETKEYASFEEIEKALADMTYETGDFGDMSEPVENELEDVSTEPADSEDSVGDFFLTDPVEETPDVSKDDHIFKSVKITKDGSRYVFDAVLNKVEGQIQGYDMSDIIKVSISVEMPAKISAYKNGTVV